MTPMESKLKIIVPALLLLLSLAGLLVTNRLSKGLSFSYQKDMSALKSQAAEFDSKQKIREVVRAQDSINIDLLVASPIALKYASTYGAQLEKQVNSYNQYLTGMTISGDLMAAMDRLDELHTASVLLLDSISESIASDYRFDQRLMDIVTIALFFLAVGSLGYIILFIVVPLSDSLSNSRDKWLKIYSSYGQLKSRIEALNDDLISKNRLIEEQGVSLKANQGKLNQLEMEKFQLQSSFNTLKEERAALQERLTEKSEKHTYLASELEDRNKLLHALTENASKAQTNYDGLLNEVTTIKNDLTQKTEALDELNEQIEANMDLRDEHQNLKVKSSTLELECKRLNEFLEEKRELIENFNIQILTGNDKIEQLKSELNDLQIQLTVVGKEKSFIQVRLEDKNQQYEYVEKQLQEGEKEIERLTIVNLQLISEKQNLELSVGERNSQLKELKRKLEEREVQTQSLAEEHAVLKQQYSTLLSGKAKVSEMDALATWSYDLSTNSFSYSDQAALLLGYRSGELSNGKNALLFHFESTSKKGFMDEFQLLKIGNKERLKGEWQLKTKDDSTCWVAIEASRSNKKGRPVIEGTIRDATEVFETKNSLRELSMITDKVSDAIMIVNSNNQIEWVNQQYERLSGYKSEEIIGKPIDDFYHDFINQYNGFSSSQAQFNGLVKQHEVLKQQKNGNLHWIMMTVSPVYGSDQQLEKYIIVERDIDQFKRQQEKLSELSVFAEKTDNFAAVVNKTGHLIWNNHQFEHEFGEVPGPKQDIVSYLRVKGVKQQGLNSISEALQKRTELSTEVFVDKDQETQVYALSLTPQVGTSNDEFLLLGKDISVEKAVVKNYEKSKEQLEKLLSEHEKQAEAFRSKETRLHVVLEEMDRLRSELDTLNLVADKTDNAIYITDAMGQLKWSNQQFEQLTGYSARELKDAFVYQRLRGEKTDTSIFSALNKSIRAGKSFKYELFLQNKGGEDYYSAIRGIPLLDHEGEVEQYLMIASDLTDQREAEEKLENLTTIANEVTNAVLVMDMEGRMLWVNRQFEQISGESEDQLVERHIDEVIKMDGNKAFSGKVFGKRRKTNAEELVLTIGARTKWYSYSFSQIFSDDIENEKYLVVLTDIQENYELKSELELAEKKLKEYNAGSKVEAIQDHLENEYKEDPGAFNLELLTAAPVGVGIINARGYFEYVNDAFCGIYGVGNADLVNKTFTKIARRSEIQQWKNDHQLFISGKDFPSEEKEITSKDGVDRNVTITFARLISPDNQVKKVMYVHDQTRQKQLELEVEELRSQADKISEEYGSLEDLVQREGELQQALEESQNLALVASKTDSGVIITDQDLSITYVNAGFERISGYRSNEANGRKPESLLHGPDTNPDHIRAIQQGLNGRRPFTQEIQYHTKGGDPYWVSQSVTPIIGSQGEVEKYLFIQSDHTKLKEAQEHLQNFTIVASNTVNGVIICNSYGEIEWSNQQVRGMLGNSSHSLEGRRVEQLFSHYRSEDDFVGEIKRAISYGHQFKREVKLLGDRNEALSLSLSVSPILDDMGTAGRFMVILTDLSEQHKIASDLAEAEERVQNLLHEHSEFELKVQELTRNLDVAKDQAQQKSHEMDIMIHNAPIGICVTNASGIFEQINDSYCQIYGYRKEDLEGQHFTKVVKPEDINFWKRKHDEFIAGRDETRGEFNVLDARKRELHILADSARVIGQDGKPRKITYVVDLTERKKLEQETRDSEEQLRILMDEQLLNAEKLLKAEKDLSEALSKAKQRSNELDIMIHNAPIGICVTDANGNFVQVNDSYCQIYGFKKDELVGKSFTVVVKPQDVDFWKRKHDMFIQGRDETRGEFNVLSKEGKELHILADSARVQGPDGKPRKITYVVDMTERKKLEEETREAEAQMRTMVDEQLENTEKLMSAEKRLNEALEQAKRQSMELNIMIDNAPIGICVTNPEGKFEQINDSYCQIYGYKREDLIGQSFTKVVKPQERDFWINKHKLFIDGRDETRGEFNVLDAKGKELHILADSARIMGQDGEPRKITYVVDMTERKRLEKETLEAEEQMRVMIDQQLENTEKLMRAEEQLNSALEISKKRENELDIMIDSAPIGICVTDPSGLFEQVNESYCEIYGYTREELIGKPFTVVVKQKDIDFWIRKHEMFIEGKDETRGEFSVVAKTGKELHILADSARIIGGDGLPRKITYVVDMTERKRLEKETQEAEEQMRIMIDDQLENTEKLMRAEKELSDALTLSNHRSQELNVMIDNAPIGICVTDPEGCFEHVNDSYCEIYGYKRKDLVGKPFTKVVKPKDIDFWIKKHQMFIDGQDETRGEFNVLASDGTELHILADSARVMGQDGRPRKITYVVDMTDRKRLEKETEEAADQMRHLLDKQYEDAELLMKKEKELELALEEERERKAELDATMERLKETQTQMVQNEKMASIGQLTAGIAHEINNPINFVYNGIDSLKMSLDDLFVIIDKYNKLDPRQDVESFLREVEGLKKKLRYDRLIKNLPGTIEDIKTGANRTIEIVKGLRVFSRLDEEDRKHANINECLDSTLILLRNKTKDTIRVKKFYDNHIGDILCYPGQLNQVFMNLITNAIQAIPEERKDGELSLYTENLSESIIVRIMDNGMGIPEDVQKRIFEPFFTTKPVGIGTGLGLSISFGIIEKHNGKIYVNSKVGKGTEFVIELPKENK